MSEKDNVSMSTVQMKPDYAASEVYSTTSEAPPAYKRQSNSVKIAKITAFTVIVASFILGAFILASSYLQAKASCDQVQALDSVLEKELMLETLQQVNKELPRAEALMGKEKTEDADLQNIDQEEPIMEKKPSAVNKNKPRLTMNSEEDNSVDSTTYSDSDETEEVQKFSAKVPLELDLSDLAAALLQNNKRSRMNCVVERKHAEEIVDSPSKTVALPFGMNLTTDPKKARITGERISIYCEGGNENNNNNNKNHENRNIDNYNGKNNYNNREEDDESDPDGEVEAIRPMFVPYQRLPIPFGPVMQQFPLTHMPQRMMPPQAPQQPHILRQMTPPFQPLAMRPPMPPQVMQAPRPEPQIQHHHMIEMHASEPQQQPQPQHMPQQQTVRIQVHEVPYRDIHMADDVPVQIPAQHQELPMYQIQRMPLSLALQRTGITVDDLRNIQRMAEERITDELRHLAAEEAAESAEKNSSSSEETTEDSSDNQLQVKTQQQIPQQQQQQQDQRNQILNVSGVVQEQEARMATPQHTQRLILQQLPEQPRDTMGPPMLKQAEPQPMLFGRATFGRSLLQPVRIPVPMMQAQADMSEDSTDVASEAERPHFVQPRSV